METAFFTALACFSFLSSWCLVGTLVAGLFYRLFRDDKYRDVTSGEWVMFILLWPICLATSVGYLAHFAVVYYVRFMLLLARWFGGAE